MAAPRNRKFVFLISLVVTTASVFAAADDGDLDALLDGVETIASPGVPGPVCVFGSGAFPLVLGGTGGRVKAPVVAAGTMGAGRVVAFGHGGFFGADALAFGDTGRLVANAVIWSARRRSPAADEAGGGSTAGPRIAIHGQRGLLAFLQARGLEAFPLEGPGWTEKLNGRGDSEPSGNAEPPQDNVPCDVLCICPATLRSDEDLAAIERFVRQGGGLVAADLGWGWLQLNPGKSLVSDHPGNRLVAGCGLAWADGYMQPEAAGGFPAAHPDGGGKDESAKRLSHAVRALDAIEGHAAGSAAMDAESLAQAVSTVIMTARTLPPNDRTLRPRLRRLVEEHGAAAVPSPDKPVTLATPLPRIALTMQIEELKKTEARKVRAHPAAATFPGSVPDDARTVTRALEIDTGVPGWHSTGLYAPPGAVIEVRAPKEAERRGFHVRIGAHSDSLWHLEAWNRCPEVCSRTPIITPVTRAVCAFGGLVYIEVTGRGSPIPLAVTIKGAVEAPRFVLGETPLEEWRSSIRLLPAPWAELETKKVILTLPSRVVRALDDPADLMAFWDSVIDCCSELAARPLKRERPERYVTDVQISAGYMHAGYPIMTHLDIAEVMVDKARITAKGHGGVWGLFHEVGHNHQSGDWTFAGTGEVTVNLFTLYVFDRTCGMAPKDHESFAPEARQKTITSYLESGAGFEKWKRDPFLALLMYIQMQEAFGWDAFRAVFAEYRDLAQHERPKTDDEKRDQWLVRFSRRAGRNLGPFFEAWGVPTSREARASIVDLPAWMPADMPVPDNLK